MKPRRYAVVGRPIAHSKSPEVQMMFAKQLGLPIDYVKVEPVDDDFERLARDFFEEGGRGLNVTLPYKKRALELADEQSHGAKLADAANTLKLEGSGGLSAINTDGAGFQIDLANRHGQHVEGGTIAVLGAGGASAGILQALLGGRPAQVVVANRTPARAAKLVERYRAEALARNVKLSACALEDVAARSPYSLIVNSTAAAHGGDALELDRQVFGGCGFCYDLGYGEAALGFLKLARNADVPCADGFGMLIEQAALSFAYWEGHKPATDPVYAALWKQLA